MLRKALLCVAALSMLSTAAMAASITNISQAIGVQDANLVGGLSADGRFVGITHVYVRPSDQRSFDAAAVFDTQTNTYGTFQLNSGNGHTRGVENFNGVPLAIVREGTGIATWKKGLIGSSTSAGYLNSDGAFAGNANAMAMDANGNGWMVGTAEKSNNARAWQITNGTVNATAVYDRQVYNGNNVLNGVSRTGMAVGNWNDGQDRAYLANVVASTNRALNFSQISSSNRSQGNAVSSNGVWAGGYVFVDDANVLNGWRLEIDPNFPATDGTYTRLLPVGFDPTKSQQSNVFDIADDGTAVGFSYDPTESYHATLWASGSDQGVRVWDILTGLGVDLSEWEKLERVISISDDGLTIAGRGVLASDGSYSAFVAVIPEPATLSFLALGGLALLRRRR